MTETGKGLHWTHVTDDYGAQKSFKKPSKVTLSNFVLITLSYLSQRNNGTEQSIEAQEKDEKDLRNMCSCWCTNRGLGKCTERHMNLSTILWSSSQSHTLKVVEPTDEKLRVKFQKIYLSIGQSVVTLTPHCCTSIKPLHQRPLCSMTP